MPPRRLPNLPLPRTPLTPGRKALSVAQRQARDDALVDLADVVRRHELVTEQLLAAAVFALEQQATHPAVGRVLGMSPSATSQWLMRSRRRGQEDLAAKVAEAREAGREWVSL